MELIKYQKTKTKPRSPTFRNKEPKIRVPEEEEIYQYQQAQKIKRKIRYYCQANEFNLFWTLTFDDEKVDAKDYPYAKQRLRAWLKYQRETYGKFDYIFVAELHKSGRIHFHGITNNFNPPLVEARSSKTNRLIKKGGLQIYNAPTWKNGFSTVSKIQDKNRTASYISKYITKDLMAIPTGYKQPRYFVSRGLKQPEIEFLNLSDQSLADFAPAFVSGEIDIETQEFTPVVSIYNLKENEQKAFQQVEMPETVIKSRFRSKLTIEDKEHEEENSES